MQNTPRNFTKLVLLLALGSGSAAVAAEEYMKRGASVTIMSRRSIV
ncbi:hypothetical protein [Chromatium okenii]|nr:hypothetical protein [Chromatium okenii]